MLNDEILANITAYKNAEKDTYFLDELAKVESKQDEDELYERFYTDLEFGTGGIRGIIEAGTNRLNTLIVQRVADGWARYLLAQFPDIQPQVVIAFDSRHFSDAFTEVVAKVLTAYNIKVYTYPSPRPTPQLSFSIRILQAQSGLVITASHNPPKYNGLKIYWDDGGQVVFPHDTGIMKEIETAKTKTTFPELSIEEATKKGLYEILDDEYDNKFREYVHSVLINKNIFQNADGFKVVYTPLHGTGAYHIETLFADLGIDGIIEPSQKAPDGDFPTVKFPNPEDPKALINAIETAKKHNANLVVATDPDADRVGLAEKQGDDFVCLTGNQIGALLFDYILFAKKEQNTLKDNSVFINTIVTTSLQEKIAKTYGLATLKAFTGFKNIAEMMMKVEKDKKNFIFSCEESYGYIASMAVRDKDGISISMLCIEMAKYYASKGKTLSDRLEELFIQHGFHQEKTVNIVLEGKAGKEQIGAIMEKLRTTPPQTIGKEQVVSTHDYQKKVVLGAGGAVLSNIEGFRDNSNVLIFTTESGNQLCMRPSGTEPKIKFYFLYFEDTTTALDIAKNNVEQLIKAGEQTLQEWLV